MYREYKVWVLNNETAHAERALASFMGEQN